MPTIKVALPAPLLARALEAAGALQVPLAAYVRRAVVAALDGPEVLDLPPRARITREAIERAVADGARSDPAIARALGVTPGAVQRARATMGIRPARELPARPGYEIDQHGTVFVDGALAGALDHGADGLVAAYAWLPGCCEWREIGSGLMPNVAIARILDAWRERQSEGVRP